MEAPDLVGESSLDGRAPYFKVYLKIAEGRIRDASFQTFGCGVMIACGSILTEKLKGLGKDDAKRLEAGELAEALGGIPSPKVFCAELAITALTRALDGWPDGGEESSRL
jgi:NifU-like protein involved in Fe-S cluster formation